MIIQVGLTAITLVTLDTTWSCPYIIGIALVSAILLLSVHDCKQTHVTSSRRGNMIIISFFSRFALLNFDFNYTLIEVRRCGWGGGGVYGKEKPDTIFGPTTTQQQGEILLNEFAFDIESQK